MLDTLLRLIRQTPVAAAPESSAGMVALELNQSGRMIVWRPK